MTSDIEALLAEVREPQARATKASSRRRIVIGAGIVGAFTILVSGGALAFGAVATLADPPPVDYLPVVALPDDSPSPSFEPAPPPTAPTAAPTPTRDGPTPPFDVNTDIDTIPIPADLSADEVANTKIWLTQQSIMAQCMGEKGFHYTYSVWWWPGELHAGGRPAEGEGPGTAFWVSLWGEDDQPLGVDYDWKQAGCHGYAVHVTGMDDAN